ncbi:MAG TPA: DUF2911 domain-containing protein [Opitutaceae bacterium]
MIAKSRRVFTNIALMLAVAGSLAPIPASAKVNSTGGVSPHETTSTVIGGGLLRSGCRVTITYGRPFSASPKSGEIRKIWGALVPWDKAWRLGSDEATLLVTQKALKFGDTTIPAGAHTLYLVPSEKGVSKLAFSSNLGKWGVPVDESTDIARVPATKGDLAEQVDQLTISIAKDADTGGGVIHINWEKTRFSVPFTVAN